MEKPGDRIILAAEMPGPRNRCSQSPVKAMSKEPNRQLRGAALRKHSIDVVFERQQSDAGIQAILQQSLLSSCFDKGQRSLTQCKRPIQMTQTFFHRESL